MTQTDNNEIDRAVIEDAYKRLVVQLFKRAREDVELGVRRRDRSLVREACAFLTSESAAALAEELLGIGPDVLQRMVKQIAGSDGDLL